MKNLSVHLSIPVCILLFAILFPICSSAGIRMRGSLGIEGYGYQDADGVDHRWVHQRTRLSIDQTDGPFSLRFAGGYLGDNADDFGDSGRMRFLEGVLQYGGRGSAIFARLGRFFQYRGVAAGVMDGVDFTVAVNNRWSVNAFAGLLAPVTSEFELEDSKEAFSMGGRVNWNPGTVRFLGRSGLELSYTRQQRAERLTRHLVGLSSYHRPAQRWTWFNMLQIRPTDAPLRRFSSRLRKFGTMWRSSGELNIQTPDVAADSWFAGFAPSTAGRIRLSLDRAMGPEAWFGGIEASYLVSGSKHGVRGGPVISSPWGQIGYRFSAGDQSLSTGPWAALRAIPFPGVEVYARGAVVSYEWDRFDIESDDLMMIHTGIRLTPRCFKALILNAEYQAYQTPQLRYDRRLQGGLTWRFDTGGRA